MNAGSSAIDRSGVDARAGHVESRMFIRWPVPGLVDAAQRLRIERHQRNRVEGRHERVDFSGPGSLLRDRHRVALRLDLGASDAPRHQRGAAVQQLASGQLSFRGENRGIELPALRHADDFSFGTPAVSSASRIALSPCWSTPTRSSRFAFVDARSDLCDFLHVVADLLHQRFRPPSPGLPASARSPAGTRSRTGAPRLSPNAAIPASRDHGQPRPRRADPSTRHRRCRSR